MWPKRAKRPKVAGSVMSAYLRGRLVGLQLGLQGEAELYSDEAVALALRVAFAVGVASKRHAPVMSERQVRQKVDDLLDLAEMVAEVEGGDDDPGSSTPPAAVSAGVGIEETARLHSTRWIGDPLPSTSS